MITSGNSSTPPVEPSVDEAAEKEVQRRVSFSHHGARASGFEDAAKMAQAQAGKLFIENKDGAASLMRAFAMELGEKGRECRCMQLEYKKP